MSKKIAMKRTSPGSQITRAILLLIFLCGLSGSLFAQEKEENFKSVEERRIYALMQEERKNIEQKRQDLIIRENELKSLEASVDKKIAEIDGKITELKNLQKRIEGLLKEKSAEEKKKTVELSAIYEKMAPDKAALAMTGMDPNLATELLANMKPKSAARILNMLDKNTTSQLSTTFTTIQIE